MVMQMALMMECCWVQLMDLSLVQLTGLLKELRLVCSTAEQMAMLMVLMMEIGLAQLTETS
eukprot:scaffold18407_cov58-Skeletonema_marinoi.AAC.1